MKWLSTAALLLSGAAAAAPSAPSAAGGPDSPIDVAARNYTDAEGALLQGYLSVPKRSGGDEDAPRYPAVIILHDADGPDDYEQQRATILASDHGWVGFAADVFGVFAERPSPDQPAWAFTGKYTGNATLFSMRTQAAIDYVQSLEEVDETKVAIIGYCMGGTGVVHYLNTHGDLSVTADKKAPIVGGIGVHPSLMDWPGPLGKIEVPALFLTGGNDFLTSPQTMAKLEGDMKSGTADVADAPWETVRYAKIEHAFSNWFSERYDARADARSWHSAVTFLEREFGLSSDEDGEFQGELVPLPQAQQYYSEGVQSLVGFAYPPGAAEDGVLRPVVIVLPHETSTSGPDDNDRLRAQKIVEDTGYMAFLAEIRSPSEAEETLYSNITHFVSRVEAAVEKAKSLEGADPDNIALVGFGSGGSGALYYATLASPDQSVKVIASFHGHLKRIVESWEASLVVSAAPAEVASGGGDASAWTGGGGGGGDTSQWTAAGSESNSGTASQWTGADSTDASQWTASGSGGDNASQWAGGSPPGADSSDSATASDFAPASDGATRRRTEGGAARPKILIQSGVEDDDMADVIMLESALIAMGAEYELTRFSDASEKFTIWSDDNYDARAASRSMDQLYTTLAEVFPEVTPVASPTGSEPVETPETPSEELVPEDENSLPGYEFVGRGSCRDASGSIYNIYPRVYMSSVEDKETCGEFCGQFKPVGEKFRGFEWTGVRSGGECWCYFDSYSNVEDYLRKYASGANAQAGGWGGNYIASGKIASLDTSRSSEYSYCYRVEASQPAPSPPADSSAPAPSDSSATLLASSLLMFVGLVTSLVLLH